MSKYEEGKHYCLESSKVTCVNYLAWPLGLTDCFVVIPQLSGDFARSVSISSREYYNNLNILTVVCFRRSLH